MKDLINITPPRDGESERYPGTLVWKDKEVAGKVWRFFHIADPDPEFIRDLVKVEFTLQRVQWIPTLRAMPPRTHSYRFKYGRWSFGTAIGLHSSICSDKRILSRLTIGFGLLYLDVIYASRQGGEL